jgi:hypothetical protein
MGTVKNGIAGYELFNDKRVTTRHDMSPKIGICPGLSQRQPEIWGHNRKYVPTFPLEKKESADGKGMDSCHAQE